MKTKFQQLFRLGLGGLIATGILIQGCSINPQSAQAQDAIERGFGLSNEELNRLDTDAFVKLERKVYVRNNSASSRPDPYHAEKSNTVIEINWALRGGVSGGRPIRFEQRDGETGQLLALMLIVEDKLKTYDSQTGDIRVMDFDRTPRATNLPAQKRNNQVISLVTTSDWAKPAWLITEQADVTENIKLQTPAYIDDLAIAQLERRWTVDQGANQLVKFEVLAKTASGEVVLESTTALPPLYGKVDELATGWFDMNAPIASISQTNQLKPTVTGAKSPNTSGIFGIDDSGRYALLQEIKDAQYTTTQSAGKFRITQAGHRGDSIEYIFSDKTNNMTIRLIQGPKNQLVPAMKSATPEYEESRLNNMIINGENVNVWLAASGKDSPNSVAMFVYKDSFIYVQEQNGNESALIDFLSSLKYSGN